MLECRMCEKEIPGEVLPIDGLCSKCHISLCDKELGKCVKCAQIIDNMLDFTFKKPEEEDE